MDKHGMTSGQSHFNIVHYFRGQMLIPESIESKNGDLADANYIAIKILITSFYSGFNLAFWFA